MRSLLGFAFPLFGTQMYHALGYGGGNSLLGGEPLQESEISFIFLTRGPSCSSGLAIVLGIPFPIWIYYKGEQMRARNSLTRT